MEIKIISLSLSNSGPHTGYAKMNTLEEQPDK